MIKISIFVLLTSSMTSILGGLGFVSHSAADLFMDAFANKHWRMKSFPCTSVNWDGLQLEEDGQLNAALKAKFDEFAITPGEAAEVFRCILSMTPIPQVAVSTVDLPTRLNRWVEHKSIEDTRSSPKGGLTIQHARPNVPTAYEAPRTEAEMAIAEIWQELLGIKQVGIFDNYFELGGDSLSATQAVYRMKEKFNREIPLNEFVFQTLAQIAAALDGNNVIQAAPSPGKLKQPEYFFFGLPDRSLYGVYHPAAGNVKHHCGVLLSYPFGHEYIRSHRTYRHLAIKLSDAGFDVLRFDFYGCGDSSGDFEQARLGHWLEDITLALEQLKLRGNLNRLFMGGLRLGGTLASIAALERRDIDGLILWEPVISGEKYLEELLRAEDLYVRSMHRAFIKSYSKRASQVEVLGYPITSDMVADLKSVDLMKTLVVKSMNIFVLTNENSRNAQNYFKLLNKNHGQAVMEIIEEPKLWLEEPYKSVIPAKSIDSIVSWVLSRV